MVKLINKNTLWKIIISKNSLYICFLFQKKILFSEKLFLIMKKKIGQIMIDRIGLADLNTLTMDINA